MSPDRQSDKPAQNMEILIPQEHGRRLMAALSYINVLFLVPLLFAKKDDFIRFHLRQGILMFAVGVPVGLFCWIPILGWIPFVAFVAASVYAAYQAVIGNEWTIPYVGKYAERIRI